MKTYFHNRNFALGLAFLMRLKATRKWPVSFDSSCSAAVCCYAEESLFGSFCQVIFYDSDWNPTVDQQVLNSKRQACLGRFLLGQSGLKFWPDCGVEFFAIV